MDLAHWLALDLQAIFWLKGEAFPKSIDALLEEGRNAGDRPGSLSDAQARIDETIALLDSLTPDALDANADKPLAHELPNGMIFDLSTEQYARDWTLAQFYFHVMTAYSILRSEKIELGKADYVAHMFQYIRPETMPKWDQHINKRDAPELLEYAGHHLELCESGDCER